MVKNMNCNSVSEGETCWFISLRLKPPKIKDEAFGTAHSLTKDPVLLTSYEC